MFMKSCHDMFKMSNLVIEFMLLSHPDISKQIQHPLAQSPETILQQINIDLSA